MGRSVKYERLYLQIPSRPAASCGRA
jgi:hypothetical protein